MQSEAIMKDYYMNPLGHITTKKPFGGVTMDSLMNINGYAVHPWSASGLETCITVKKDNMQLVFDLGYCTRPAALASHVFITHGHMDHCQAIVQHASKRLLYRLNPATYYVPHYLVKSIQDIGIASSEMSEKEELKHMDIKGVQLGEKILLPQFDRYVKPFETFHRVPSQGYIVYHIESENAYPEIAYTGDTRIEAFTETANQDVLRVKLLIMEATYLDDQRSSSVEKCRNSGHTHLFEIRQHADLFKDVESILLVHFSDKYTAKNIQQHVMRAGLPSWLLQKIHLGRNFFLSKY